MFDKKECKPSLLAIAYGFLVTLFLLPLCTIHGQEDPAVFVLEELPGDVIATMEARDRQFAALAPTDATADAFHVDDLLRWTPGRTLRVAFLGGDSQLHREVAEATESITNVCNIKLDFGFNATTNSYRQWSTNDSSYAAEIRVSFDMKGNFSLVGRDSINRSIGAPDGPVGGRPGQRTLNLGGFDIQLPPSCERTIRHEFLHALAFRHEHQSPFGGCDAHFRWENDEGYVAKQDDRGMYIPNEGKRPGIYTYLSGYPNYWDPAKVDHNLRQHSPGSGVSGAFDRASIMLYRFPPLFYTQSPSPCAPLGQGEDLSQGDKDGLTYLYPHADFEVEAVAMVQRRLLEAVAASNRLSSTSKAGFAAMMSADNAIVEEVIEPPTAQAHEQKSVVESVEVEPAIVIDFLELPIVDAAEPYESEPTVQEFTEGPDVAFDAPEDSRIKIDLFKIKNWPEFKVETTKQCRKVFGKKVCINVPQAFQRNCELEAFAEISHPDSDTIRASIEDCARQAVAAGVLTGIYTGNIATATAALKTYLQACLAAKGTEHLSQLSVTIRTETKCGPWKPR